MRLFLPARKYLLPRPTGFVAMDPDGGPFSDGISESRVTLGPAGASWLLAGLVAAGVAVILLGPHHDSTEGNLAQIRQQAADGEPAAELQLALDYRDGRLGLPADHAASARWLSLAAGAGNPYAEALLGDAYNQGDGVPRDLKAARRWWRQAARSGNGHAETQLGLAMTEPSGQSAVQQSEGKLWLDRAAAQGDPQARTALGVDSPATMPVGSGNPGLFARLAGWFDRVTMSGQSADSLKSRALGGDNVAQYQLAMRYRDGAWGVNSDPDRALGWLRMSAEHGNPVAMSTLADAYEKGELGLTPDPALASAWRQRAAEARAAAKATE
jgi:TPR repeat protein